MIHPSYVELMRVVNNDPEIGEEPVVNSRYSIVLATAKRARQIISGAEPLVNDPQICQKPLSIAVEELYRGDVKIVPEDEAAQPDTEPAPEAETELEAEVESDAEPGLELVSEADPEQDLIQ